MIISVVIPVYNASLLLTRCLDSVFTQKGNFKIEVICVDDGSTDNSVELIKSYPQSITLLQQANQGPASARNAGIAVANGKYLAFLDADDYWKPEFLSETVGFLETHKEAVAVSVGQKHIIPEKPEAISPAILKTEPGNYTQSVLLNDFYAFWAKHNHVCTGSVLMLTETVKKTGGQRPELRITEDLEFWAFLGTFGKWGFIPKVLFVSDGGIVTRQISWIKKNKKRWNSAPSIETWEERIIQNINPDNKEMFAKARGRIAKNLAYSMIMSNRILLARKTCLKYGNYFPKDKVGKLMLLGSKNRLFWFIPVICIQLREHLRII